MCHEQGPDTKQKQEVKHRALDNAQIIIVN